MKNSPEHDVSREYGGERGEIIKSISVNDIPSSLLLVGYLNQLVCETPNKKSVNAKKLLKSSSKPLVCASGDGKLVIIVSSDTVAAKNLQKVDAPDVKSAINLHADFHGVEPPKFKKVDTQDLTHLVFFGWLKHIVYTVPSYSERAFPKNIPFIHEAGDRGEEFPKAKSKPIVCFSPAKDMIIMYGDEMSFTDRGIVG